MTDTLRTLDLAVQAHLAEAFEGEIVDAWILVAHAQSLDDDRAGISNYRIVTPNDGQPWHTDAGLIQAGTRIMKDAWDFSDEDD